MTQRGGVWSQPEGVYFPMMTGSLKINLLNTWPFIKENNNLTLNIACSNKIYIFIYFFDLKKIFLIRSK